MYVGKYYRKRLIVDIQYKKSDTQSLQNRGIDNFVINGPNHWTKKEENVQLYVLQKILHSTGGIYIKYTINEPIHVV